MRGVVTTALVCVCLVPACLLVDEPGDEHASLGGERLVPVLFFNEIRANEPGSDVTGEFVELVNLGDGAADLTGFSVTVGASVRHAFADGSVLEPGSAVIIFGGAAGIPGGLPVPAIAASSGALGLTNSGNSVALFDDIGAEVDRVTYSGALSGTDGVSMNRSPYAVAGAKLVLHAVLASAPSSPGTRVDGTPFDGDDPPPPPPPPPGKVRLRVAAANLTSGNGQDYDLGHGIRILQGLDPDIALVQEMNFHGNTPSDLRAFVDLAFGPEFDFARQDGVNIPSGVVSRHPIVESGVWDDPTLTDRDFVFARIDVPGDRDLWAVTAHLPGVSATRRVTSANALIANISAQVPPGDYLLVGGDLNTNSRGESCIGRLAQVVRTSGPFPVDQGGNSNTNAPRNRPYDWVLADGDLDPLEVPTEIGSREFADGLVLDTRLYQPLSDVAPAQSGDSAAPSMQHMAVVRDFEIPGD